MTVTVPIGDVVEALVDEFPDISISKVRYLESQGLVTPERAPSGYRRYSDANVAQLRWVLRQQRDHFLPLKIIKEKLSTGDVDAEISSAEPVAKRRRQRVDALQPSDVDLELSRSDLLERTGCSAAALKDLERFALVQPTVKKAGSVYSGDDLLVVQLAMAFLEHGIEPRHLRPWKVAVDREAGLLDQRLGSIGDEPAAVREALADLVQLGDDLRSLLLRRALDTYL